MSHSPNTTITTITNITNATFIIILINNMHCNYSRQYYLVTVNIPLRSSKPAPPHIVYSHYLGGVDRMGPSHVASDI